MFIVMFLEVICDLFFKYFLEVFYELFFFKKDIYFFVFLKSARVGSTKKIFIIESYFYQGCDVKLHLQSFVEI
jgi:hypothetical protein